MAGDPQEPASWRRGPKAGASYRSFGTVSPTRGRWKAFYVGPDRHRHTAGLTFSNQVRAQGWLANELGLIEQGEWTPPARPTAAVADVSTRTRGYKPAIFTLKVLLDLESADVSNPHSPKSGAISTSPTPASQPPP